MIPIPVGPFKDFNECVAHFSQDPDVDDPQAMCGWLEQQDKDGTWEDGDKAIWGVEVEFMSPVSAPAVTDSEWLQIKEQAKDPSKVMVKGFIPLLRRKTQNNPDDRIVYAAALIPDKPDGNHEAIPKFEIKKAAIKYMEHYRKVDNEHSFMDGDGTPIFSWILQKDETFIKLDGTEKEYPEGTWMMGVKIKNEDLWKMYQSGERTGFSIAGSWKVLDIKCDSKGGNRMSRKQDDGATISTAKRDLEKEILRMLKDFEMDYKVSAGGSIEIDRGQWGDGVSWEDYEKRPIGKVNLRASIKSQSSSEIERSIMKVKKMEDERVNELIAEALAKRKLEDAEQQSQKEAEDKIKQLEEKLATVMTELAKLKKSDGKPPVKKEDDDEDEEEEDGEKQDEEDEEEDDEKGEFEDEEDEEEDVDEKSGEKDEKATKSYESKNPKDPKDEKPKQTKGITNAKITVIKKPQGDFNHE